MKGFHQNEWQNYFTFIERNGPVTLKEIMKAFGVKHKAAQYQADKLVEAGLLYKQRAGIFETEMVFCKDPLPEPADRVETILEFIGDREVNRCDLEEEFGISQFCANMWLSRLHKQGILDRRSDWDDLYSNGRPKIKYFKARKSASAGNLMTMKWL